MSYEILYKARFIKLSDGRILPLIEAGSNNCYEVNWKGGNARRSRSWCFLSNIRIATPSEILGNIERIRQEQIDQNNSPENQLYASPEHPQHYRFHQYKDESFGYYTGLTLYGKRSTTYSQFYNFFKNGIKNAKTLEEWGELRVTFSLRQSYGITEAPPELGQVSTESQLLLSEDNRYMLDSYGEPKSKFANGWKREYQEQDHYFKVKTPYGYLMRNTARGYKYGIYGTPYKTMTQAMNASRGREGFIVERIDSPMRFSKKVPLND